MALLSGRSGTARQRCSTRSSTSSCPTAPTSTTGSSMSSPSRPEPISAPSIGRACGALAARRQRESLDRRGWRTSTCTRCPRCCTTARSGSRPRSTRRRTSWRRGTRRLAVAYADCGTLRRARRGLRAARGARGWAGALLRRVRRRRPGSPALLGAGARHLRAHRLPRAVVPAHGAGRARAGPLPGAARRLLPALHPGGVAGAARTHSATLRAAAGRRPSGDSACRWSRCAPRGPDAGTARELDGTVPRPARPCSTTCCPGQLTAVGAVAAASSSVGCRA